MTNSPQSPLPPVARREPRPLSAHGHTRVDDYYWLRDKSNPAVIAYLESENEYTATMMAHSEDLQRQLYEEMVGRIQETDSTVPVHIDEYYYYSRTEAGLQYSIFCRKQGNLEAREEVLLDLNLLAADHNYLRLGIYEVSPDHRLLAYSLDTSGAEAYQIYCKDLASGELLADVIPNTHYSAEWGSDGQTLYYTTRDEVKRSDKVWRHRLGTPIDEDELLFHEADERFWVSLYKSRDRRYVMLLSESMETGETHFLPSTDPAAAFAIVQPRQRGMRYHVSHHTDTFYIVTDDDAENFKLMTAPVATPDKDHWSELIPHRSDVKIDDIDLFANHLVVYERQNGLRTIRIVELATGAAHDLPFPEPVYTYRQSDNPDFTSSRLRFTYSSLTTPNSVYEYDMVTGGRELLKMEPVLGGYEPQNYTTERLFAAAPDGTRVPISIVYRNDQFTGSPMPCLLYGYGAYGYSTEPDFNSNRLSLLDRGYIYAIAHIRGGQEMGRHWYEQGKYLHKRNTFTDFIACAEHLIAEEYTDSDHLAIMGGSAGGLLVGAVLNMAPFLFRAAVAAVPFVDVVTSMLDESIPLTTSEYEEWGNPNDPDYYEYMLSYSPYDNVTEQEYPHLLITAGLNDPRVQYWEPAKWIAKLRALKQGNNRLLLKTEMGAGHAGPSGRYDYLKEVSLYYAFILDTLGVEGTPT